jgi:hypothetical protein
MILFKDKFCLCFEANDNSAVSVVDKWLCFMQCVILKFTVTFWGYVLAVIF